MTRSLLALTALLLGCAGDADTNALAGTWRMDPARSRYAGTAETRTDETFTCEARAAAITCHIVGIRLNGDTTRASFVATPGGGAGSVTGVAGVDRVLLIPREDGYEATFLHRAEPVLGYRIQPFPDSLVVRTTDVHTGDLLDTRIVYVKQEP